jgi:deazaflavin-dependent oxidoreductase (nitroreductase family)
VTAGLTVFLLPGVGEMSQKTWVERMPYPKGLLKWLYKLPILLYRLGLGFAVGRLFMVLTTTGRKSGQPRRTAIEFHEFEGKPTVMSGWGTKADWYRNLDANPLATIQTWRGAQSVRARRITSAEELTRAFEWAQSNPTMRSMVKIAKVEMTLEEFLAEKERFIFVTFEPSNQITPSPLRADLAWLWVILLFICLLACWQPGL